MKHTHRKPERFKGVLPLAALILLAGALQAMPAFAEETAAPATPPAANTAGAQNAAFQEKMKAWREQHQAKRQDFLEKHPELKQKLDANNDGVIDKTELKQARETRAQVWQEKRQEKKQAYLEKHPELQKKLDANGDGKIDPTEFQQSRQFRKDRDNNPPGKKGGPGTNWEKNDYRKQNRDRDNNPPGRKGGPGTNWENRPGPAGGAGASPDKKEKKGGWWGKK